jgi:hypothetical protein
MTRFDQALGRGYRIGDATRVPAQAGFGVNPPVLVANHGNAAGISRWKATLFTTDPEGNAGANDGARLRFVVTGKMENEIIPRRALVTRGEASVIYAPGRSISIAVYNPMDYALYAQWQIDEATAGISRWEDGEIFASIDINTEYPLDIPPFCQSIQVFSGGGVSAPTLRGYQQSTQIAPVYVEVVTVPRSEPIPVVPGLSYTIEAGGLSQTYAVYYACFG